MPTLSKVDATFFLEHVQPGDVLLLANPNSYDLFDFFVYKLIIPAILPSGNFADHAMLVIQPAKDKKDILVLDSTTEQLMDRLVHEPRKGKVVATHLFADKLSQYNCPVKLMWVRPKRPTDMKQFVRQHHGKSFVQMSDNAMIAKTVIPQQTWVLDWFSFIRCHAVFAKEVSKTNGIEVDLHRLESANVTHTHMMFL